MHPEALALPPGFKTPALWQLLRYSHAPLRFLEEGMRRYGDAFLVRFSLYGKFIILASPEAVRDVFRGDAQTLHSGESNQFLIPTVGPNSVLVLDEEAHARQRRIQLPPLKGERMLRATSRRCESWQPHGNAGVGADRSILNRASAKAHPPNKTPAYVKSPSSAFRKNGIAAV